jgi:hypothetical protein
LTAKEREREREKEREREREKTRLQFDGPNETNSKTTKRIRKSKHMRNIGHSESCEPPV